MNICVLKMTFIESWLFIRILMFITFSLSFSPILIVPQIMWLLVSFRIVKYLHIISYHTLTASTNKQVKFV